jgi:hypothetical protein
METPFSLQWTMGHPMPTHMTATELEQFLASISDIYRYAMDRREESRASDIASVWEKGGYTFAMNCLGMVSDFVERYYHDDEQPHDRNMAEA